MHRLAMIIAGLAISCGIATAQDRLSYVCPTIFIEGPDRVLKPGETARLNANVKQVGAELPIKYNWHVSYGKILSGQGTATIEVEKTPSSTLTATIEIDGTP